MQLRGWRVSLELALTGQLFPHRLYNQGFHFCWCKLIKATHGGKYALALQHQSRKLQFARGIKGDEKRVHTLK